MGTIQLQLRVGTQDISGNVPCWMAFEQRLGIVVFADTEEAAEKRLGDGLDFLLDTIVGDDAPVGLGRLFTYLDKRNVPYTHPFDMMTLRTGVDALEGLSFYKDTSRVKGDFVHA